MSELEHETDSNGNQPTGSMADPFANAEFDTLIPKPGDRIDRYFLQRPLGQGVSCFVFRAWDEVKQMPVAIKIVNWTNVRDREAALKQLRTETAVLSRVRHPRVVRLIDFGHDKRWPYLVLEFVEGRPLGAMIREGGPFPANWALYLLEQVVDGLSAVWKAGIVHRDLKPDNVIINVNGTAKLIDFGVAKFDALSLADVANRKELAGTAAYLAPEQAREAGSVDLRADIYSLGVTLYEMLTGRLPFDARNRMQMIMQHFTAAVRPPRELDGEIPERASDLCLWMLAKNPNDRPRDDRELREALRMVASSLQSA